MPAPVHVYEETGTLQTEAVPSQVNTAVEQAGSGAILFGGIPGVLRRMDLQDGKVEQLLTLPEQAALLQVVCNADGSAIATVTVPNFANVAASGTQYAVWAIWSAEELLRRRTGVVSESPDN
jgi:hypothetical protein